MSVPNTFNLATGSIPLSQLDANFAYYDAAFQINATTFMLNRDLYLEDRVDNTKIADFDVSAITTGTMRTYTLPNSSGTFALIGLAQTWSATQTFSAVVLNGTVMSGNIGFTLSGTTSALSLNAGQTTGTITIGGTAGTGTITIGQSTAAQTLNLATGANTSGVTKTVNIGASGASGSITNINLGSAVAGATGKTTINSEWTVVNAFATEAPITVNATTHTVLSTAFSLIFTTTTCTVTLPSASTYNGRMLMVKNVTATAVNSNASNVVPLGSTTAGTAILAATAGKFALLQSDGTNWIVMMAN
jgi:hypothetical protein